MRRDIKRDQHGDQGGSPDKRWSLLDTSMTGGDSPEIDSPDAGSPDAALLDADHGGDPVLAAVAAELRRPVELDAGLDARVMALVAGEAAPRRDWTGEWKAVPSLGSDASEPSPLVRAWRWLRRPRLVSVSPLTGLAATAAVAAIVVAGVSGSDGGELPIGSGTDIPAVAAASSAQPVADDTLRIVQFVLVAPDARSVALVGDFNDWQEGTTPLRAAAEGRVWSVEVPLTAGRHRYAFVVNGEEWVPDPTAPRAAGDDFGVPSSVVTVAGRSS